MEKFENIKGVIFDYGGTIDSRAIHWSEVIWDGYHQMDKLEITKEQFRESYVNIERELAKVRHILPEHNFYDMLLIKMRLELQDLTNRGLFADDVESNAEIIAKYCYDFAHSCVEEARPTLEKLYAKYPMVLVSNFYGNVESVLKDFDLDKYFKEIVESAVVGVRKPDPQIFQLGVDALGLKPEEVVVIGDSYTKDIIPARTIGCKAIWIKGKGWTDKEDSQTDENMVKKLSETELPLLTYIN